MPVLNKRANRPPDGNFFVGIGVFTSYVPTRQRHVAIVYSPHQGEVRLSHLNTDYDFRDEPWDHRYEWSTTPELDEYDRPTVVARLNDLRASAPRIPFGFRTGACRFEDVGGGRIVFRAGDPSEGLTCSTFAELVFRSLGFPVVNAETWPQRPEDEQWRRNMIQFMRIHNLNPERVQKVAEAQRDARVRPEEFVGSFVQADWPVDFQRVGAVAQQVVDDLEAAVNDPPVVPLANRPA